MNVNPDGSVPEAHAEAARSKWHAWMWQQERILRLLQSLHTAESVEAKSRVIADLNLYTDAEIARACAEGAVCIYLKTREVTG